MILNPVLDKSRSDEITAGDIVTIHAIENKLRAIEKELKEADVSIRAISESLSKLNNKRQE